MANKSDSKLRFTIEESVWLRNGQEVAEVLSMSLNPEIMIEEMNEQILIKGYLYLNGEYKPLSNSEDERELEKESLKDQLLFRSLDQINETAEGVLELEHRFPVDITIPKQRIANVDEVYVNVESFDYDLPSHNCIELTADIEITGLNQVAAERPESSFNEEFVADHQGFVDHEQEMAAESTGQNTFEEFEFEARRAPEEEVEEEEDAEENVVLNESVSPRNRPPVVEMKSRQPEYEFENSNEQVQSNSQYSEEESFIASLKSLSSYKEVEQEEEEEEYYYNNEIYSSSRDDYDYEEKSENQDYSEDVVASERPIKEENALYLTSILTREEEEFSRLKMCIIQPGESLETVAGRYDITTSHLIRFNRLDSEEVSEGQILYIPIPAGRV